QILSNKDVIGMTTNGAAKFQNLLRYIDSKIIICEEAGEVLEAHILSALTPSTQHLILIGDHNQLRPHIATYNLSMDSSIGMKYQLDKSLFERLVDGNNTIKIEKTQLLTQRRMRKIEISELIKETLYKNLEDGDNTVYYPKVRGAQHNVYFIDHRHPEKNSGSDLAQSHVNPYEVKMVVEMVKYFVKNGYTKPKDIAVLTPYIGQMIKIEEALSESFAVLLDERDTQNISNVEQEDENDKTDKKRIQKSLNQQVTLRTVDNFQGEEANIVIISLVRNFSKSGNHGTIGFLKSKNRSNVLLSRAREGMYLLGNSELMAMKSKDMWAPVINILHKRNPSQVGFGMPIVCNRHPDYKNIIIDPEQFAEVSPNGGCYNTCDSSLSCGHTCTLKCHPDNLNHVGVKCYKRCIKLHSVCGHPCSKLCHQDCGRCEFPIGDIILPGCGHTLPNARCWQNQTKEEINCIVSTDIILPGCGHTFKDPIDDIKCEEKCGKYLECGHKCYKKCVECQKGSTPDNNKQNKQIKHGKCKTKCNTLLSCGHKCNINCHKGKECPPCNQSCTVCLEPCTICAKNCSWECKHQGKCELSCGTPCNRLPCNESCDKKLKCGHKCTGVCGEICPDFCIKCAPKKVKNQLSDKNIDWKKEKMIVLSCGHAYTMRTLDTLMGMKDYYEGSIEGGWTSVKELPISPTNTNTCPECQTPIKNIRRYGRIIKHHTLDIQTKKFLVKYDRRLKEINKKI
ncbi:AAA domain-containing protein, partial [Glomus cerebriforme]